MLPIFLLICSLKIRRLVLLNLSKTMYSCKNHFPLSIKMTIFFFNPIIFLKLLDKKHYLFHWQNTLVMKQNVVFRQTDRIYFQCQFISGGFLLYIQIISTMKLFEQQQTKIYAVYCLNFVVVGCIITSLGPLFPYLAELEQREETEYSFLFLSRAIGYILGSLLIKVAEKYMIFHRIIIISLFSLFTVVPFTFAQTLNQKGLFVFIMSVGNAWTDIGLNICIIETFKKTKNLDQWLQIAHGGFGIGGLIGPYVVYLFEEYSFLVLGAMGFVLIPFYFIFPSPEIRQRQGNLLKAELIEQNPENKVSSEKEMRRIDIFIFCMMFWLLVGQQSSYSGWVPSYAVMNGYSTKQHATLFSSIYWITITVFRFIFSFLRGKSSQKLIYLYIMATGSSLITLFIIHSGFPEVGLILGSILLGAANSVIFPLTITLPQQFGYKLTTSNNSNFMLFASIGEGTLSVLMGLLMSSFLDLFFYGICFMNIFLYFSVKVVIHRFSSDPVEKNEIEMKNLRKRSSRSGNQRKSASSIIVAGRSGLMDVQN